MSNPDNFFFLFPNTETNTWQLFAKILKHKVEGGKSKVDTNNLFEYLCFINPQVHRHLLFIEC